MDYYATEQERQQSRERIIEDMIDGSDTARVLEAVRLPNGGILLVALDE